MGFDIESMQNVVHWVTIVVKTKMGGELVEWKRWEDMRWEIRTKWNWYFTYRAALFQVKYPRYHVDFRWGHEPVKNPRTAIQIQEAEVTNRKRQYTKFNNKIELARKHWNQLFPIEADEDYIKMLAKVNRLRGELDRAILKLEKMKNDECK